MNKFKEIIIENIELATKVRGEFFEYPDRKLTAAGRDMLFMHIAFQVCFYLFLMGIFFVVPCLIISIFTEIESGILYFGMVFIVYSVIQTILLIIGILIKGRPNYEIYRK
jgi:uncharacterized protein YqhQ